MAIGTANDFKVSPEEFFGGMVEVIEQNADAFNVASNNALRLVPERKRGHYESISFISQIANLVTRRDLASTAALTDAAMSQGETVGIKINRKIGPVANTIDSFRKLGGDASEMSFLLGRQVGKAVAVDYVNTALSGTVSALSQVAAVNYDASGDATPTLTHQHLVTALSKMGDSANQLTCWVMHSKAYFDLMSQAITDKIFEVSGVTIYEGSVATFNRPTIVVDSPALFAAGTPDTYSVLGLVENAVEVAESEERSIVSDVVTGYENLIMRIQGEYAFNLRLKGFGWDTVSGGVNPTDTAIATGANWLKVASDDKSLPGVRLKVQ